MKSLASLKLLLVLVVFLFTISVSAGQTVDPQTLNGRSYQMEYSQMNETWSFRFNPEEENGMIDIRHSNNRDIWISQRFMLVNSSQGQPVFRIFQPDETGFYLDWKIEDTRWRGNTLIYIKLVEIDAPRDRRPLMMAFNLKN